MNFVNKTLYIPLYGKSFVSHKGIILHDKKAEELWNDAAIPLKRKSKSKWLAYYMGMRSRVFDEWVKEKRADTPGAVVLHIGCGLDSRVLRIGDKSIPWYDVDFPEVIEERKKHYSESDNYRMISGDARECAFLKEIPKCENAIIVMEGVSMYLTTDELTDLLRNLREHFGKVSILIDFYTTFAAKASKYKNPINDVGVTKVYGLDDPKIIEKGTEIAFLREHDMTPDYLIDELSGMEKKIFRKLYAGKIAKKMYKLYEFFGI